MKLCFCTKKGIAPLRELLYILDKLLKVICISTSLKEIQIISIFPTLRSSCGTWTPWTSVTLLSNFALSSSPTPTWPSLQECCRQLIIRQLSGNICFPLPSSMVCAAGWIAKVIFFAFRPGTKYNIEDSGCQSGMFEFRQKVRCDSPVRTVKTFTEL